MPHPSTSAKLAGSAPLPARVFGVSDVDGEEIEEALPGPFPALVMSIVRPGVAVRTRLPEPEPSSS
jgi:hypothetical protein